MITIFKYQFEIKGVVEIEMPEQAKILSCQLQSGIPTIWAMVNTELAKEERTFRIYGIGSELEGINLFRTHIGTLQMQGLVFHIFE